MAYTAFILFSNSDFSSIGVSGKGVREAKLGNKYCKNYGQSGWKFDSGEVNPHCLREKCELFWTFSLLE